MELSLCGWLISCSDSVRFIDLLEIPLQSYILIRLKPNVPIFVLHWVLEATLKKTSLIWFSKMKLPKLSLVPVQIVLNSKQIFSSFEKEIEVLSSCNVVLAWR